MNTSDQKNSQSNQQEIKKASCENHGEICQDSLDKDIYRIEEHLSQLNELKELREAARPLSEYLKKHFNPHTTAIVTSVDVRLVEDIKRVEF